MQRFFKIFFMAFAILHATSSVAQDTLWFHVPDRFTESDFIVINQFDSIQFRKNSMYFYYKPELGKTMPYTVRTYSSKYDYYTMHNPGRIIYKPNEFRSMNFNSTSSRWPRCRPTARACRKPFPLLCRQPRIRISRQFALYR